MANILVNEVVCRYGVPETLHSDQGTNFESSLFQEVCNQLGIHRSHTSPYHPQGNGQVERFNRSLNTMLAMYVSKNQDDWDEHLPRVLMAYRTSKHDTTKCSPYYLLFGAEAWLPLDTLHVPRWGTETLSIGKRAALENAECIRRKLDSCHALIEECIREGQARRQARYQQHTPYKVGDSVWLHQPRRQRGLSHKLQMPWDGPFTVQSVRSPVTYQIAKRGGRPMVEHHD